MTRDEYISERLVPQMEWYELHAGNAKRRLMRYRVCSAAFATTLMIIIILLPQLAAAAFLRPAAAAFGALLLASLVLPLVHGDEEHWLRYRQASEALKKEHAYVRSGAGPYESVSARLQVLVPRAEHIISSAHNPLP